ncbi:MAG TPA: phosphoribosylformylglycinamidine synthase subunit PurQ [Bacteroidota bacterium]
MSAKVKFGVVVFPGSNCDHDAYYATHTILGQESVFLWHKDTDLQGVHAIILPGGFSYGDYLRCGAIARFSPIMKEVVEFARAGGVVVGICNGFQVLLEAGLLPGVLLRNASLRFVCKTINMRVENNKTPFTSRCQKGDRLRIPVAHGEGNYFTDAATLASLEKNDRILFRYCSEEGEITEQANPNGSLSNIAGIMNEEGNVMGLMPHPERVVDPLLRNTDGRRILNSIVDYCMSKAGHELSLTELDRR